MDAMDVVYADFNALHAALRDSADAPNVDVPGAKRALIDSALASAAEARREADACVSDARRYSLLRRAAFRHAYACQTYKSVGESRSRPDHQARAPR